MFSVEKYKIVNVKIENNTYRVKDSKQLGNVILHITNQFSNKSLIDKYMISFRGLNICEFDWTIPILNFSKDRIVYLEVVENVDIKYKLKLAQFYTEKKEKYDQIDKKLCTYDYLA